MSGTVHGLCTVSARYRSGICTYVCLPILNSFNISLHIWQMSDTANLDLCPLSGTANFAVCHTVRHSKPRHTPQSDTANLDLCPLSGTANLPLRPLSDTANLTLCPTVRHSKPRPVPHCQAQQTSPCAHCQTQQTSHCAPLSVMMPEFIRRMLYDSGTA